MNEIVINQIKENLPEVVSYMNLNGMMIIDKIASQIKTIPQLNDTNASERFQTVAYSALQLPGAVAKNMIDNIDNVDKSVNEFEHNVIEALVEDKSDDKKDDEKTDANSGSNVNVSSETENNDAGNPHPESNSDDTSKSNKKRPEVNNRETQLEANLGDTSHAGELASKHGSDTISKPEAVKVETQIEANLHKD